MCIAWGRSSGGPSSGVGTHERGVGQVRGKGKANVGEADEAVASLTPFVHTAVQVAVVPETPRAGGSAAPRQRAEGVSAAGPVPSAARPPTGTLSA